MNVILEEIKHIKSDKAELRKFGLSVGTVFAIAGAVFAFFGTSWAHFLWMPGIALVVLGLIIPAILLPVQKVWMGFAVVMGFFMTRVILSLVFFLMVTPIGLIGRILGRQYIPVKPPLKDGSYWNYREDVEYTRRQTERMF